MKARRRCTVPALAVLLAASFASAQELAAPKGGVNTMPRGLEAFRYAGKRDVAEVKTVSVDGMPFGEALRVTAGKRVADFWHCQLLAPTTARIRKDDACLLTFHARTVSTRDETAEGRIASFFQRGRPDYRKSLMQERCIPDGWKHFFLPFRCHEDYAPGEAVLGFGVGLTEQVVELADIRVLSYGKRVPLTRLPRTRVSFDWLAPDAPWRAAAARRIDEHRKGDLVVRVNDAAGKPVAGATVVATMKRHAFGFGSALSIPGMYSGEAPEYKRTALELFNRAGNENALKWEAWDGEWGRAFARERTIEAFRWFRANVLETHGHVLVWPGWRNLPKRCRALRDDKEALRKCVEEHVRSTVTAMKGLIDEWDVINEPFNNHDLMDLLGRDVMIDWFKIARAADPNAKLMINDFGILSGGKRDTAHRRHYEQTIRFLLDGGAPLDMIGLQGHFGGSPTDPETVLELLDRYARFGKPLQITEFDVNTDDEQLQADYTEAFMTVVFSHPAVSDLTMWGFWEALQWRPNAAMYRKNWETKPNGEVFKKLVFDKWWTRKTVTSGADGLATVRGFCGTYQITASANGRRTTLQTELNNVGETVTVVLD